jgi:hypothetical protein
LAASVILNLSANSTGQALCLAFIQSTKRQNNMKKALFLDLLAAVVIGLLLAVGALAYFDVLTK